MVGGVCLLHSGAGTVLVEKSLDVMHEAFGANVITLGQTGLKLTE